MKKINSLLFMLFLSTGLFAQDSLDCPVSASFTYEIEGGMLNLTNTTMGATMPYYNWSVDGLSSWEENPSFSTAEFEAEENVCLTVYDSLEDCSDTYCMLIYFADDSLDDSTDCPVDASFTYLIEDGLLNLTNTSTGATMPIYNWSVDGLSSYEEHPSFPTDDFEDEEIICLELYDSLEDCSDTYCLTIYLEDDSTWTDSTARITGLEPLEVNLYPNPVNDVLNLSFGQLDQEMKILIFNQLGELILSDYMSAGTPVHEMNVATLNRGIYIIYIQPENEAALPQQYKFVKQ